MLAWELNSFGLENLELRDLSKNSLLDHEVRVKIHAASLNYRDLMVIKGFYNPKLKMPVIPLSDGAGEVVEVGKKVSMFSIGDRVCATFSQNWAFGPPTDLTYQNTLGSPLNGMLAEYGVFHEQGLVKFPEYLDYIEASTLPCAAVTAFHALFLEANAKPNDTVLLLGTGGVSLFALQLAKTLDLKTIIISSCNNKLKKAQSLGADHVINYINKPEWSREVLNIKNQGVDVVIEVGGAKTLPQSIASVKKAGVVCVIGVLTGVLEPLDLRPVLMNNIRIQGVFTGSKEVFLALNRVLTHSRIKPVIDKVFDFKDATNALAYLESGQHFGKVCIKMPKE
jgi:NADPH:quinone reductase-like Zn-dependent oxidoreductase